MAAAADENGGWKFAQCFGDKGNQDEITEGRSLVFVVHYFAEGGGERRAGTTPEEGGRRPPSVAGFISFWVGGKSQALANTLFFTSYPQQTYTKKNQPTSSPPSSLTAQVTTSQRVTRAAVSSCLSVTRR